MKEKKTNYAWAVLRRGKSFAIEYVFPRWLKLFEVGKVGEIEFLTIFPNKKSAEMWRNHWANKEDFEVRKIVLPFRFER